MGGRGGPDSTGPGYDDQAPEKSAQIKEQAANVDPAKAKLAGEATENNKPRPSNARPRAKEVGAEAGKPRPQGSGPSPKQSADTNASAPASTASPASKSDDAAVTQPANDAAKNDDDQVAEASGHVAAAASAVAALQRGLAAIEVKAADGHVPDEAINAMAADLDEPAGIAQTELTDAWQILTRVVANEVDVERKHDVVTARASMLKAHGLKENIESVTQRLAASVSAIQRLAVLRPSLRYDAKAGGIVHQLSQTQAVLGLPQAGWNALAQQGQQTPTLTVHGGIIDVGSGTPRNQIDEATNTFANAWNRTAQHFVDAAQNVIATITMPRLQEVEPAFLEKFWERAKELLLKGAALVSGTELAGTIGIAVITKLLEFSERAEAARAQGDKDAYISAIKTQANDVMVATDQDGGKSDIHKIADKVDQDFLRIGLQNPDDAWKPGDRAVVGAQAKFLRDFQTKAEQYNASIPSIDQFEGQLLAGWVNANHVQRNGKQDGYVAVDATLRKSSGNITVGMGPGVLHCPNAGVVATDLMRTLNPFRLLDARLPVMIKLTVEDETVETPQYWTNGIQVSFNEDGQLAGTDLAKRHWRWVLEKTHSTTDKVLSDVTRITG